MNRNSLFALLFTGILFAPLSGKTQEIAPFKLKAKEAYQHASGIEFPKEIGKFKRIDLLGFDTDTLNVGAFYRMREDYVSIYVYPSGVVSEGRLRKDFAITLSEISAILGQVRIPLSLGMVAVRREEIPTTSQLVTYTKDDYTVYGLRGDFFGDRNERGQSVTQYECGPYYFKVRITTKKLDFDLCHTLDSLFTSQINPVRIIEKHPLPLKTVILLPDPESEPDSTLQTAIMASALARVNWIDEHVESKIRQAGVADWNLNLQRASYETFAESLNLEEEKSERAQAVSEMLNAVIEAGFLNEYIIELFEDKLEVPEGTEIRYAAYEQWKRGYSGSFLQIQWNNNIQIQYH